ncbi:MAG: SWIM zinc finger domain-containing protein [Saprospiraceae bacterium]
MNSTIPNIKQLAPDAATFSRSKSLSKPEKWRLLQANTNLVWGECKSSGAQYYKTVADLTDHTTYCTCPSRKVPCKHALALLKLVYNQVEFFQMTEDAPTWVAENLAKRDATPDPERVAQNEANVEKNKQKRLELMRIGFIELERWLQDVFRQGLASLDSVDSEYWLDLSARMVDAKLGSVGRRIKSLMYLQQQEQWHEVLLKELAELYLLAQGFKNLDQLPANLQTEILTTAGVNLRKQDVLNNSGVKDYWLVIGQTEGEEDNLNFRRTWLLSKQKQQFALLLDFTWGNNAFEEEWEVGQLFWGEVVYYPGNYPQRGIFKFFEKSEEPFDNFSGCVDFKDFQQRYAKIIAANPWLTTTPALLEDVIPIYNKNGELVLVDILGKQIKVKMSGRSPWTLLALSGGQPICLFGEWKNQTFIPLSSLAENRLIVL